MSGWYCFSLISPVTKQIAIAIPSTRPSRAVTAVERSVLEKCGHQRGRTAGDRSSGASSSVDTSDVGSGIRQHG